MTDDARPGGAGPEAPGALATVRAVSLDVWLTLLRSNPRFKAARDAALRSALRLPVPDDVFSAALRSADVAADRLVEADGRDRGLAERVDLAVAALRRDGQAGPAAGVALAEAPELVAGLLARQRELALELPPLPLHPDLPALLAALAEHVPLAVTSNTGMLPGTTMRALLDAAGLLAPMGVLTFSDELGTGKPHAAVFAATVAGLGVPAGDVLHVGDNPVADVCGALDAGLRAALVGPDEPTDVLLRRVLAEVRTVRRPGGGVVRPADGPTAPAGADPRVRTVAVTRLDGTRDDLRDVATGRPFDLRTYSRMKHGDLDAAGALGRSLGRELLARVPALATDPAPVVLPVAYLAVPPACLLLARAVLAVVNDARAARGLGPGRVVRVAKGSVTRTDYAGASAEARRAELASIGFRLDEDLTGARVVLVDDVRVTGLAEQTLLDVLARDGAGPPAEVVTAYVAVCEPGLAADPTVESVLNHAAARSVADLADAVRAGRFALTIRFLKRLLAAPDAERETFLGACDASLLDEIADGALATGPAFCAAFPSGLAAVHDARRRAAGLAEAARG
ncbi:phosphoribosyltransferase family protein [Luteimicrobium sp. DT211]|uniref:phosphoribosyltransferase family protein n=1 Tax=Luteimicrobium sp. DT211 TaxID=3393412 RepID=UPI003CEF252D